MLGKKVLTGQVVERVGEREVSGVLDPNPRQLVPAACSLHRRLTHT